MSSAAADQIADANRTTHRERTREPLSVQVLCATMKALAVVN
jgi:hypothetical protein